MIGSEQGGYRPVIVIQNDTGNQYSPTVIVAAISSRIGYKANLPTHVLLDNAPGLEKSSIALLEQIRTIDKSRIDYYAGKIDGQTMREVTHALKISLGIKKCV